MLHGNPSTALQTCNLAVSHCSLRPTIYAGRGGERGMGKCGSVQARLIYPRHTGLQALHVSHEGQTKSNKNYPAEKLLLLGCA